MPDTDDFLDDKKELWRLGTTVATGFINPENNLVYIGKVDHPFRGVILSIEDLARIIVAHQKRRRRAQLVDEE